ncbi:DUF2062 domain-containing protein [Bacillus cereus group sp. BfR-BA-01380]|uniref:DUF2062 domain-containing protein n=1 Tax=Bacillus cereus group sp. BfR-BA-01380 TaxID=2920324 RepID=UPI001F5971B9|nr:DUF2062 domain-containing protein [Bacillus cereus group sp. BfR-BA-01380]
MRVNTKTYSFFQRIWRGVKLNYYKLLRAPEGAKIVSRGFAVGFGMEMLVIHTASLVYLIFYPLVRLLKGSFPAAVIGNIIGKATFLPVLLIPFAHALGKFIYPFEVKKVPYHHYTIKDFFSSHVLTMLRSLLQNEVYVIIGMTILGIVFGIIAYFVMYHLYEKNRRLRLTKRKKQIKRPIAQL